MIFGFDLNTSITPQLTAYKNDIYKAEMELKKRIEKWFYDKFQILCDELKEYKKLTCIHMDSSNMVKVYNKISNLEIEIDAFLEATSYQDKKDLWIFYKGE